VLGAARTAQQRGAGTEMSPALLLAGCATQPPPHRAYHRSYQSAEPWGHVGLVPPAPAPPALVTAAQPRPPALLRCTHSKRHEPWRSQSSPRHPVISLGMFPGALLAPGWGKCSQASPQPPASGHTLVVFTLLPLLQLQPERSGSTLHSSPSRQGSIWHHHFCSTTAAGGEAGVSAGLPWGPDATRHGPRPQPPCRGADSDPPASGTPCFLPLPRVKSLATAPSLLPARAGRTALFSNLLRAPLTEAKGLSATTLLCQALVIYASNVSHQSRLPYIWE